MNMNPTLFFTCGLPGSGKSLLASRVVKHLGGVYVSRDATRGWFGSYEVRKESHVVEICKNTVQAHLANSRDVVYDSAGVDAQSRMRVLWWAKELYARNTVSKEVDVVCLYTPVSLEESIARRPRTVKEEDIILMNNKLVVPTEAEGFRIVTVGYAQQPDLFELLKVKA
jgi:predicted kinase